jgi:hypothetical protein
MKGFGDQVRHAIKMYFKVAFPLFLIAAHLETIIDCIDEVRGCPDLRKEFFGRYCLFAIPVPSSNRSEKH